MRSLNLIKKVAAVKLAVQEFLAMLDVVAGSDTAYGRPLSAYGIRHYKRYAAKVARALFAASCCFGMAYLLTDGNGILAERLLTITCLSTTCLVVLCGTYLVTEFTELEEFEIPVVQDDAKGRAA
jgi:hypothetical protein